MACTIKDLGVYETMDFFVMTNGCQSIIYMVSVYLLRLLQDQFDLTPGIGDCHLGIIEEMEGQTLMPMVVLPVMISGPHTSKHLRTTRAL